jgi:hypothetical protein
MDENGTPVTSSISMGNRLMDTQTISVESGRSDSSYHTKTVDDSTNIRGGTGFTLTKGETAKQLLEAYHGDFSKGAANVPLRNQIVQSYVQSLSEYGLSLSAASASSFNTVLSADGNLSFGVGQSKGPTSIGLGVKGGAAAQSSTEDRASSNLDAANTFFRTKLDQALEDGQVRARNRFGDFEHNGREAEANSYIANYAEVAMSDALLDARQSAERDLRNSEKRSHVLKDSQ